MNSGMMLSALPWLISNDLVPWCEEVVYEPQTLAVGGVSLWQRTTQKLLCLCIHTQIMGTKTIGLRDDVYNRLKARKREDESFTDLMDRLLEETTTDWRDEFGTLPAEDAQELEQIVADSRDQTSEGLSTRQQEVLDELANNETA